MKVFWKKSLSLQRQNKIENILKYSEATKENYFITLDKIKKVIFPNANQKR